APPHPTTHAGRPPTPNRRHPPPPWTQDPAKTVAAETHTSVTPPAARPSRRTPTANPPPHRPHGLGPLTSKTDPAHHHRDPTTGPPPHHQRSWPRYRSATPDAGWTPQTPDTPPQRPRAPPAQTAPSGGYCDTSNRHPNPRYRPATRSPWNKTPP